MHYHAPPDPTLLALFIIGFFVMTWMALIHHIRRLYFLRPLFKEIKVENLEIYEGHIDVWVGEESVLVLKEDLYEYLQGEQLLSWMEETQAEGVPGMRSCTLTQEQYFDYTSEEGLKKDIELYLNSISK